MIGALDGASELQAKRITRTVRERLQTVLMEVSATGDDRLETGALGANEAATAPDRLNRHWKIMGAPGGGMTAGSDGAET